MSRHRILRGSDLPALNILVTGAGGRIGRRLIPLLAECGHRVIAVDRCLTGSARWVTIEGDLLVEDTRVAAFSALLGHDAERKAVVHLAGLSDSTVASDQRTQAFIANVQLTQRMLESAISFGAPRFLLASTGLVYARENQGRIVENAPVMPRSVYAATKLAAETIVQGYAVEGLVGCEILRLSNVYGPESPENTVIGRILGQMRRGEPVAVMSREPVRDFIFVDDVASAICGILQSEDETGCRITNISSGVSSSVGEVVDIAQAVSAGIALKINELPDRVMLCNEAIRNRIGWQPRHTLPEGLRACLGLVNGHEQ